MMWQDKIMTEMKMNQQMNSISQDQLFNAHKHKKITKINTNLTLCVIVNLTLGA